MLCWAWPDAVDLVTFDKVGFTSFNFLAASNGDFRDVNAEGGGGSHGWASRWSGAVGESDSISGDPATSSPEPPSIWFQLTPTLQSSSSSPSLSLIPSLSYYLMPHHKPYWAGSLHWHWFGVLGLNLKLSTNILSYGIQKCVYQGCWWEFVDCVHIKKSHFRTHASCVLNMFMYM